jgi:hypothetical protein
MHLSCKKVKPVSSLCIRAFPCRRPSTMAPDSENSSTSSCGTAPPSDTAGSRDLSDMSPTFPPVLDLENVLDKLRLCAIMARQVLGVLGFGMAFGSILHYSCTWLTGSSVQCDVTLINSHFLISMICRLAARGCRTLLVLRVHPPSTSPAAAGRD